jgi:hypothetical protein
MLAALRSRDAERVIVLHDEHREHSVASVRAILEAARP